MTIDETFQRRIDRVAGFNSRADASLAMLESESFFSRKAAEMTAALPPRSFFEERQLRHKMAVARDVAKKAAKRNRPFVWERHGGIRFWKIGRLGGSFYVAKK